MTTMTTRRDQLTTAQKLARLAALRDQAGRTTYDRIRLACEIREDDEWIVQNFRGDPDAAETHLEDEFLADLCGTVSFNDAHRIYSAVPDIADWKACKFNLKSLYALMKERTPQPENEKRERRSVTVNELEEEVDRRKDAEYAAKQARAEADLLRSENVELKLKVSRLEGRIEQLERDMKR